ncbi:MAG: hypothetical protein K2G03_01580, partial [Bacilli bacterium]|nr:hypothetical protein [Bacilli bacterium]
MKNFLYLKAVVIVHGKSEKQICQHIKQKLRLRIEIESDKNGEKSIQITSLNKLLNNKKFKSKEVFLKNFPGVEVDEKRKNICHDFKIFIIMDTDDCTEKQRTQFINKEMFKKHWAYEYITPIYNSPELETVLEKAKVHFTKTGANRKKEYIKLFPTDAKYEKTDVMQIEELLNNLSSIKQTNLDEFLKFCLDIF